MIVVSFSPAALCQGRSMKVRVYRGGLVPRLLSSFLLHTVVCDKKLGRSLGTRLYKGWSHRSVNCHCTYITISVAFPYTKACATILLYHNTLASYAVSIEMYPASLASINNINCDSTLTRSIVGALLHSPRLP